MSVAPSGLKLLSAAWGMDIRAEDFERAISLRNPQAPRAKIERVVDLLGKLAEATETLAEVAGSLPPSEAQTGAGLGEMIEPADGTRRLHAAAAPLRLEDWAGPCAKPSEIATRFGIARSTLDEWRRTGAAVGLLAGARKHVFPIAQFIDGRPLEGLAELTAVIGDPRTAWLWLVEPSETGQSWLERLRRGQRAAVLAAAREDFA